MMIVTCESCKTKFRFDPSRARGSKKKVRCSRCGHVFLVKLDTEEEALIHVDLSEDMGPEDDAAPFAPPPPGARTPGKAQRSGMLRKLLLWLVPLALLAGGAYYYAQKYTASPSQPLSSAKDKPPQPNEQPAVTIMDSTRAYFLENAHAGQIFVVEGEVSNESSRPISFILLEGKLYTTNNQIAQTQRCYPGNGMPRNELAQLNVTEIQNRMMNREGKNLTNVNVAPSKRIPFMLVFHNLPEMDALGDYSIEVISAKFDN
ncbi:MAG: DUF3426 domain-containing protein [Syntrophobacteraceae bacterium]|nr:zinc-ribbon domain-containing protein [Desulfobacteraceae bacterium]